MNKKCFEVSAAWMQACGLGNEPAVFPIVRTDENARGAPGFDAFHVLQKPNGFQWVVAACRGRVVDCPPAADVKPDRVLPCAGAYRVRVRGVVAAATWRDRGAALAGLAVEQRRRAP